MAVHLRLQLPFFTGFERPRQGNLHLPSKLMEPLQPKSAYKVLEEANRIGVQFLLTDLTAALTFLDLAEGAESSEKQQRNRNHAQSAYETVLRLMPSVSPTDEEFLALDAKLKQLRTRLVNSGSDFNKPKDSRSQDRSAPG